MLRPLRIAITSGDANGIGPEVIAKALRKIGPKKGVQFLLWRNPKFPKPDLDRLKKSFHLITVNSWADALKKMPSSSKEMIDICTTTSPANWVEEAAQACFFGHLDGLATAPLSKPLIRASGIKDIGHTEILKRVAQVEKLYMAFVGEKFNVMLATGHLPLKDIPARITPGLIIEAIKSAHQLTKFLVRSGQKEVSNKPMALLGLNPHAGDSRLLGSEEAEIIEPALNALERDKYSVEGPLVPDAAFSPDQWEKYSLYIALYHDQGLIPFKTVHGRSGVHITWGLPFVRTSVDHGTAFDIAGQNKADATSMRLAIEWAIKLSQGDLL